jgi:hypothetical protein
MKNEAIPFLNSYAGPILSGWHVCRLNPRTGFYTYIYYNIS